MHMTRILFFWDVEAFGGHDLSALVALRSLAENGSFEVGVLHSNRCARLTGELQDFAGHYPSVKIYSLSPPRAWSECVDALISGRRTRALREAICALSPDFVVNVQGFITLGLCVLGACRDVRMPVISYLPMTHRVWTIQPSPIAIVQDLLNRYWYSLPAVFIVTSGRMKDKLVRQQGVPASKIAVVEYGPDLTSLRTEDRAAARRKFNLPDKRVVGVLGRIEFRQKRQDFLIRAVARHRAAFAGFLFLIVGEGPDLADAEALVEKLQLRDQVRFLPWQQDMTDLYASLDAVLIPSRFEGVPLVMLEAMARRIPVLASAVDGMADILPAECLFDPDDVSAMVDRICALPHFPGPDVRDRLKDLIAKRLNASIFARNFERVVCDFATDIKVGRKGVGNS
jgi:glycosyltransferase involved in cell wall biosynthesis